MVKIKVTNINRNSDILAITSSHLPKTIEYTRFARELIFYKHQLAIDKSSDFFSLLV